MNANEYPNSFDIAAEEKLVSQNRISSKVEEREFEIELRNHKESDIIVKVEKQLYGFWELINSNIDYKQKDANKLLASFCVSSSTNSLSYQIPFSGCQLL